MNYGCNRMMQAFKHLQGSFLEPTRRRSGQVIFPAIRTSITVSPETFGELCDFCEKHNRRCGFLSVERFTRGSGWKWNIHFLKTMVKNDYHNDQGTKWAMFRKKHELCSITRRVVFFIGPRPVHAGS